MTTQTLKDNNYRIIGYIETRADGVQVGKDANFRIKGYYDPRLNQTKDSNFRVVGQGNLLAALVVN